MKKQLYLLFWILTPISLLAQVQVTKAYIQQYKDIAIKEMKRTGIPASITLAQAIVESSSGESNLAKKFNNHFGIKCKLDWKGETTYQDDDTKKECFRVYPSAFSSFKDHSDFLKNRPNYASLFELDPVDDTAWAYGLKKAGYATANDYPKKLLKVIDDYELSQYNYPNSTMDIALDITTDRKDAATPIATNVNTKANNDIKIDLKSNTTPTKDSSKNTLVIDTDVDNIKLNTVKGLSTASNSNNHTTAMMELPSIPKETVNKDTTSKPVQATVIKKKTIAYPVNQKFRINQVPAIWAEAGRSYLEIADTYHISLYKLFQYNDLKEMDLVENDQIIFLAAKKKESDRKVHTILSGETLYDISQSEGLQLAAIKEYNPSVQDKHLLVGTILYLFKIPAKK